MVDLLCSELAREPLGEAHPPFRGPKTATSHGRQRELAVAARILASQPAKGSESRADRAAPRETETTGRSSGPASHRYPAPRSPREAARRSPDGTTLRGVAPRLLGGVRERERR